MKINILSLSFSLSLSLSLSLFAVRRKIFVCLIYWEIFWIRFHILPSAEARSVSRSPSCCARLWGGDRLASPLDTHIYSPSSSSLSRLNVSMSARFRTTRSCLPQGISSVCSPRSPRKDDCRPLRVANHNVNFNCSVTKLHVWDNAC